MEVGMITEKNRNTFTNFHHTLNRHWGSSILYSSQANALCY